MVALSVSTSEESAVQTLFETYIGHWNQHDWKGCVGCMTENATLVGVNGEIRRNRNEIRDTYSKVLPNLPCDYIISNIKIKLLTKCTHDTIIVDATVKIIDQPYIVTMVTILRKHHWKIAAWRAWRPLSTEDQTLLRG